MLSLKDFKEYKVKNDSKLKGGDCEDPNETGGGFEITDQTVLIEKDGRIVETWVYKVWDSDYGDDICDPRYEFYY